MKNEFAFPITNERIIKALTAEARREGQARTWEEIEAYASKKVEQAVMMALGLGGDLRPKDAARMLDCHLNTFWNYHRAGCFPNSYYTSSRRLRIPLADVEAMRDRKVKIK